MGLYPLDMKVEATFNEDLNVKKLAFENVTPVNAVASSLTTALAGDNNDLVFTAKTKGVIGDDITIAYINPAANDAELSVVVTGTDIVVNLATGAGGAITTIASDITAAILANAEANALVSVANAAANNGTGLVIALAETNLANGVDGTPAEANKVYFDGDYLYIATLANAISGANWVRVQASTY